MKYGWVVRNAEPNTACPNMRSPKPGERWNALPAVGSGWRPFPPPERLPNQKAPLSCGTRPLPPPTTDDDESRSPVPGDIPPLRRRLPDNVLNILREEVEYERRARQGQNITQSSSEAPDPDWPATTVTDPGITPDIRDLPHSLPTGDIATGAHTDPGVAPSVAAPSASRPATDIPVPVAQDKAEPSRKTGSGYFAGFGLAAAIAAVALALYVMAPGMAGNGNFGKQLMQYRQHVDAGRQWLQQQGSALIRRD